MGKDLGISMLHKTNAFTWILETGTDVIWIKDGRIFIAVASVELRHLAKDGIADEVYIIVCVCVNKRPTFYRTIVIYVKKCSYGQCEDNQQDICMMYRDPGPFLDWTCNWRWFLHTKRNKPPTKIFPSLEVQNDTLQTVYTLIIIIITHRWYFNSQQWYCSLSLFSFVCSYLEYKKHIFCDEFVRTITMRLVWSHRNNVSSQFEQFESGSINSGDYYGRSHSNCSTVWFILVFLSIYCSLPQIYCHRHDIIHSSWEYFTSCCCVFFLHFLQSQWLN